MPDHPSDKIWDEYDWERFLQQQELRTEKYMELLEKYLNHPQRDELIAKEMGWTHLLDGDARNWEEEVDAEFEKELAAAESEEGSDEIVFGFERNPLYQQAIALGVYLDELLTSAPAATREHPAAVTLQSQNTLAAAKLAAALNDEDIEELGMSIAYLKRALHAITTSLDAIAHLESQALLDDSICARIREKLFEVRGGIVSTMGDYRAEFRRRHSR